MVGNRDDAVRLTMGCAGYCSELSFEADSFHRAVRAGRMSRISARGLVLGRRRDNDADIMALGTAAGGDCDRAVGLILGCAGCCPKLFIEANPFHRAVRAMRRSRIPPRGLVVKGLGEEGAGGVGGRTV